MRVSCGHLYHVLSAMQHKNILQDISNSYPLFGNVVVGGGTKTAKKGWVVEFDMLPLDERIVSNISQNNIMVLAPGEEESTDNHHSQAEQLQKIGNTEEEQKKKVLPMNRCQQEFAKLSKTTLVMAKVFTMTYGKGEADCVVGKFLVTLNITMTQISSHLCHQM